MASKRKPYVREMSATWWNRSPYYRFYMLRESTSIFAVWVSLLLICCLANPLNILTVLTNPLIIIINIIALAASLLHTKTWFDLAPKAAPLNENQTKMMVKGLWGLFALCSIVILLIAFVY